MNLTDRFAATKAVCHGNAPISQDQTPLDAVIHDDSESSEARPESASLKTGQITLGVDEADDPDPNFSERAIGTIEQVKAYCKAIGLKWIWRRSDVAA